MTTTADAPRVYDLLDVAPEATEAEIRAAWKAAIADLGPSDRRFRAYNHAAELLLDPERRASYDAQLAATQAADVDAGQEADEPGEAGQQRGPALQESPEPTAPERDRAGVPGWLLVGLALLTAIAVGVAVWLYAAVPSDRAVADATRAAQAAAERAVVPVLSYDADTLDADQAEASSYLTDSYREDYDRLFAVIRDNAPATGTKVSAEVVSSGIVRSGEDRVQVLVFLNRPTTNKQQGEPIVYRDQVTLTMQRVGDSWLVDDLETSPPAR